MTDADGRPLGDLSDEELYQRWCEGQERAGRELISRRLDGIAGLIRSLLSGPDVDDAIQQVFERLAIRAKNREPINNVKAFVGGVARNVVRERIRARAKHPVDLSERSLADIMPNQAAAMVMHEEERLLLKGLHRLPVDDQILLGLRYWERLRTRELAEILAMKHNTLRTRLRRAQMRLESLLHELADSPEAAESTIGSLTGWARDIREQVEPPDANDDAEDPPDGDEDGSEARGEDGDGSPADPAAE